MWSFVADQFIVDQAGKFSIIGAWETIGAMSFPAVHPQLFVVTGWKGDPLASILAETKIWAPAGVLLTATGSHAFQLSNVGKGINVSQLINLQFPQPGEYTVEMFAFGESVLTNIISVTQAGN